MHYHLVTTGSPVVLLLPLVRKFIFLALLSNIHKPAKIDIFSNRLSSLKAMHVQKTFLPVGPFSLAAKKTERKL